MVTAYGEAMRLIIAYGEAMALMDCNASSFDECDDSSHAASYGVDTCSPPCSSSSARQWSSAGRCTSANASPSVALASVAICDAAQKDDRLVGARLQYVDEIHRWRRIARVAMRSLPARLARALHDNEIRHKHSR